MRKPIAYKTAVLAVLLSIGSADLVAVSVPSAHAEINRAAPPKEQKRQKKYVHPCPAGTEAVGEAPPEGGSMFCRQPILGGYRKHGNMTGWYANGQKRYEGEYIRGRKHGAWTLYHRNGEKKAVEEWYDGKRVKKHRFDRTGKVISETDKKAKRLEKRKKNRSRHATQH
ncbi:MAG: hypothetical protein KDD69_19285 [Bdellovibrionales bacterium]|nr:hypothetical protein [Bdellovibrionales bacterium]